MAEEMLDGFAPEQHETEVSERWGAAAYSSGADWWNAKSADEKRAFQSAQAGIAADFVSAAAAGRPVESAEVQAIVERHVAWLSRGARHAGLSERPGDRLPRRPRRALRRGPALRDGLRGRWA